MSKQYNIMSACNDSQIPYIAVELTSIAISLKNSHVDFYLFHSTVSHSNIEMLNALCRGLMDYTQIIFHEIKIPDSDITIYEELSKYGKGCPIEAYYALSAHILLPDDVDRVLYINAGDIIITGDIEPYYRYGFNDKSLIVTGAKYHVSADNSTVSVFTESDLSDHKNGIPSILSGLFNSGSFILNLDKMRADERTLDDYQFLANALHDIIGKETNNIYSGIQGLMSAAFVGDIQYYFFTDVRNVFYMPYNFCLWYYNNYIAHPPFDTNIINYAGTVFKPWEGRYTIHIKRFQPDEDNLHSLKELRDNQAGYFYQWHEYAIIADSILEKIGY